MRGYSLISRNDGLAYDFVVAKNAREAKKLMMKNQSDWIYDEPDSIIQYYAKWHKKANIVGLKEGDFVEDNDLIKRNICSSLEYGECEKCEAKDTSVYLIGDKILCETCEQDMGE